MRVWGKLKSLFVTVQGLLSLLIIQQLDKLEYCLVGCNCITILIYTGVEEEKIFILLLTVDE